MLNNDYKIITKALANRMKSVLDTIINMDQTGFMKGRYIGDCYLFNIVIEILAIELRANPDIEAVELCNNMKKILGQYADDIWIITKFSQDSYNAVIQVFERYRKSSGLKINYDKTEVVRLGAMRFSNAMLYSTFNLKWSSGAG